MEYSDSMETKIKFVREKCSVYFKQDI